MLSMFHFLCYPSNISNTLYSLLLNLWSAFYRGQEKKIEIRVID